MMYELMATVGNAPVTGDTFPVKTILIIAIIAVAAAVGMDILTKGRNNDDEDDNNEESEEQNNSKNE